MPNSKFQIPNSTKGFTLIEMLIVISIIAILATIVLANFGTFRGSAYDTRRVSDLQKIQSYLEVWYNANSRSYPASSQWSSFKSTYNAPSDPTGGDYSYCADANGQNYIMGSQLTAPNRDSYVYASSKDATVNDCTSGFIPSTNCVAGSNWFCVRS